MILSGKKIAFLGDSITFGSGCVVPAESGFVTKVAELSGATTLNYGIGGTRIARKQRESVNPVFDQCYLDRVDAIDADADAVVVFGGTNDFGHGDAPLGVFEDTDEYTFYGALHSLVSRLLRRFPDRTIAFITPTHRISEDVTTNEIGLPCAPLVEFVKAIREVCEYYSIPVIDLYAESGLQPKVQIMKETFMPDGLHPNEAGHLRLAKVVVNRLSNL